MKTYRCVPKIASPEARKEMHDKCFEKYRCVPKIVLPKARTYRCAAWHCCVELNTTMYPTPPE